MTRRGMALAAALVVAAGVAGAARIRAAAHRPDRTGALTGSATRLGPRDGELISAYLDRARAALEGLPVRPAAGYALVSFDRYLTPAAAPALAGAVTMVRALVRVPLPRVQTEIVALPARTRADVVGGMSAAAARLDAAAAGTDRVSAAVARAQAERLRDRCACVLAVVVHAGRDALRALSRRPGVRAVEPAPPGEPLGRLAFAPLLPEQRVRVEPPPDDGAAALATESPGSEPAEPAGSPRSPGSFGSPGPSPTRGAGREPGESVGARR